MFCLNCLENLSYQQIGERLGMTANAVGVILHPARHRLRELLASVDTGTGDEIRRASLRTVKEASEELRHAVSEEQAGVATLRSVQVEEQRSGAIGDLLDRAAEALPAAGSAGAAG